MAIDLLGIGLWRKDPNVNPGTYQGKGAAAGVQDVHSHIFFQEFLPIILEEKESNRIRYRI